MHSQRFCQLQLFIALYQRHIKSWHFGGRGSGASSSPAARRAFSGVHMGGADQNFQQQQSIALARSQRVSTAARKSGLFENTHVNAANS